MVSTRKAGFTLVEAIVALTISSVVVILVSTVFLVQNQYYALQLGRSVAHDNARTATEFLSRELRSVMPGGFVVAENQRLVVRSPMVLAVVCATQGRSNVSVHYEGGERGLDTDEVSGFAVLDSTSGLWSYYDVPSWNTIRQPGGRPARDCAGNGADTLAATSEFQRLGRLSDYHGSVPGPGDVIMLYRSVEYAYRRSELDPTTTGLFRGIFGDPLVELVTGMDSIAQFRYRTSGTTYAPGVAGSALGSIDAVRLVAQSRQSAETGGQEDITYGWGTNVYMRNGR
jgi:prepilin-type N-terminal cleavage/methylation domain-containing protein